jgi:hypothetical protein
MPYQAMVLRALIASPGDTANERRVLRATFEDWKASTARTVCFCSR